MKKVILLLILLCSIFFIDSVSAANCEGLSKSECSSDEYKNKCSWSFSKGCITIVDEKEEIKACSELGMAACNKREDCSWSASEGCRVFYGEVVDKDDETKACSELGMAACNKREDCSWSASKGCRVFYGEVVDKDDETKACSELGMAACNKRKDCNWSSSKGCMNKQSTSSTEGIDSCFDLDESLCNYTPYCEWDSSKNMCMPTLGVMARNDTQIKNDVCKEVLGESFLETLHDIEGIFRIIAPLLVLALTSYDYIVAITSKDADGLKSANNKLIKRLILVAILFFLPTIINVVLGIVIGGSYSTCL